MSRILRAILCIAVLLSTDGLAHEVRPGFLQLRQIDGPAYDLMWKVPARGDLRLAMYWRMPENCRITGSGTRIVDDAFIERARLHCEGGLEGQRIAIDGLDGLRTDVLVRVERADGTTQTARLTPEEIAFTVTAAQGALAVAGAYFGLGVEHILLGIDHLLFVLALLMIVEGWRKLVATVTAFTLAHSITLAAATLGFVKVPQSPVEAVIALSILFVAAEIIHWRQGRPGITRRKPWLVAFTFGLLHGFGFAGALTEIGLPEHAIPLALLFFNVGVEAGQLLFIAAVLVAWSGLRRFEWPEWAWRIPVYGIGTMAAFWTIERIAGF